VYALRHGTIRWFVQTKLHYFVSYTDSLSTVLDLPQLYTKPSAETLLDTLTLLKSAPPSWERIETENNAQTNEGGTSRKALSPQVNPEGATRYLTGIVSSGLQWIKDEEVKEEIWNQASARLSERSGRTAMGALSRQFRIPSATGLIDLSIHEPALTGDDLGLKTWAASYLLSKRLHTFNIVKSDVVAASHVLELGSGTGLVGLAMASLGADVVLTDLPSIYPNLARNVRDNSDVIQENGGIAKSGILDWTNPTSCRISLDNSPNIDEGSIALENKFPVILAADSLYSPDHPKWLVDTIDIWLSKEDSAKVIVEFPLRDAYIPEVEDFRRRMVQIGLHILEEGEEKGYDDWGGTDRDEDDNDRALVKCWWSCWGRV
jgi:predicted nicotinamide N-methyase